MTKQTTKPGPVVTTEVGTAVESLFDAKQTASMTAAAAAVAESDSAKDEAMETFAGVLGTAPTFAMYIGAQKVFQAGYIEAMPAMTTDALAKRTTRFFSDLLKQYGMKRPESHDPAAEKKREQREAAKAAVLKTFEGVAPTKIKEAIKTGYAKLAAGVPDQAEVKKEIKKAELALKLMTQDQEEAFKKQKAALVSSINEAIKKCNDLTKLTDALKALK